MYSNTLTCKKVDCQNLLKKLVQEKESLTSGEITELFGQLLINPENTSLCAAALAVMQYRGESKEEIWGLYHLIKERMCDLNLPVNNAIDIGGTGGGKPTFNISTTAAFIVAATGVPVCKHGNYRVSSTSGSFDVLGKLQIGIERFADSSYASDSFKKYGLTFLSTRVYHNHPKALIQLRKELGIRTAFNYIGPLLNPAHVPFQIIGVSNETMMPVMAKILIDQGREGFVLAHGTDGIDEISPCAPTKILEYRNGALESYVLLPEDFGISRLDESAIYGGSPETNAEILKSILHGKDQIKIQAIIPTVAMALYVCKATPSIMDGAYLAQKTIYNGKAAQLLSELQRNI